MKKKHVFALLLILTLALIIRYSALGSLLPGTFFNIDEVRYYKTALQLVQKGILGFNSMVPNSYITPGYILFIAVVIKVVNLFAGTRDNYTLAIVWAQIAVNLGVITLIYLISLRLMNFKTAVIASLLGCIYPPFVFATTKIMTEEVFTFFFLLYVYLTQIYIGKPNWIQHGFTGVVLALAALIRPTIAPVLVFPYIIQAINDKKSVYWKGMIVALIGFCIVMSPWWVRNYQIYHKFVPFSTEGGDPFLRGTDPYDPLGNHGERLIKGVPEEKKLTLAIQRVKKGLHDNPLYWIGWYTVGKTTFLWSRPWGSIPAWGNFKVARVIHLLIIIFLGWPGLLKSVQIPRLRWLAFLPVFFTLMQLLFLAIPRYVFQLYPIMLIFAAIMITDIGRLVHNRLKAITGGA